MVERILPDRSLELSALALLRSARLDPQARATDAWREHFRWGHRRVGGGKPFDDHDGFQTMVRPDPLRRLP